MREPPPFISTEADVDETDEAIEEAHNAPRATKAHGNQRGSHHTLPISHDTVVPKVLVKSPLDVQRHLRAGTWGPSSVPGPYQVTLTGFSRLF